GVGPKRRLLSLKEAIAEFHGACADLFAGPAAVGLDAKQVVAAAAVAARHHMLAPAGLERRLRDQHARIHAELLRGLLGMRPEAANEVFASLRSPLRYALHAGAFARGGRGASG